MLHKLVQVGIVSAVIALGAVACGSAQETNTSTVTMATVTPAAVVSQASEAAQAATSSEQVSTVLPESLADVNTGEVYTFQVDPAQTTAEYAVDEVLFGNSQITRGSTNSVEGTFTLSVEDGKPVISLSNFQVDLQTLTSDNNMRDNIIKSQWLESNTYPMATFVAKEVKNFPEDAVQGQAYTFQVVGDMTIRDITKEVTFDVTVTLNGDTLTGEGTTQIYMKDFGFDPPEILGRFTVSDPATITLKGVANLVES